MSLLHLVSLIYKLNPPRLITALYFSRNFYVHTMRVFSIFINLSCRPLFFSCFLTHNIFLHESINMTRNDI